jgi:hypothetical protein
MILKDMMDTTTAVTPDAIILGQCNPQYPKLGYVSLSETVLSGFHR